VEFDQSTLKGFFEKYSANIHNVEFLKRPFTYHEQYPLLPSQAIYIADMQELFIPYQRGIERLLGYSEQEFDFDLLMQIYHPDDCERYTYLVKIANEWIRKSKLEPFTFEATFDYRVRKKNGSYIKVLRQSTAFESCLEKSIKSSFSIISDISRIKTDTSVNLSVLQLNTGRIILVDKEENPEPTHFTKREKEILLKIKKGLNSQAIADDFNCSKHTVDTHRRKMLRKAGCKNTVELIGLCSRLGII